MTPEFLTVEDVLKIHRLQCERYGGSARLRDEGLLDSAIAQPQATFDGEFVHPDLFVMAAAYLFHLVKNHAFMDGNKRTGLLSALVFLDINGVLITRGSDQLYDLTMAVADGLVGKEEIAELFRSLAEPPG